MFATGINGFGRFGLHLLKYWLDRRKTAEFSIDYINDDFLSLQAVHAIILSDKYVKINLDHMVTKDGDSLIFADREGSKHRIVFSNQEKEQIPWRGQPDVLLECSGKFSSAELNREYIEENTKKIIISATVADADQTLIIGFNQQEYNPQAKIISYGSCIINAFIPITQWLHQQYKIDDCDSNIIHNIPEHKLQKASNNTLHRRTCSLEWMGPKLLSFLTTDNFTVQKTYIPYSGISMIDMRYRCQTIPKLNSLQEQLTAACKDGPLKNLYDFAKPGQSPEEFLGSSLSAILRKEGLRIVGDNIYMSCYFDNENSVNRYFDLLQFISKQP